MLLVVPFFELLIIFILLFIGCELPQRSMDKFDEISHVIGQFNWYLFSNEIKRILPTFVAVANAEKIVEIKCFGSTPCNRKTFRKVYQLNELCQLNPEFLSLKKLNFSGFQKWLFILYGTSSIWKINQTKNHP